MGMLPSYVRLVASMHKRYRFEGPVCSLGNQDIWASYADLKACFHAVQCDYREPARVTAHSSRTFALDRRLEAVARDFVHARVLFEMLGIAEYVDLDKFDSDRPAVLHDLNLPVPSALEDRFGLLFDGGTIEHIFDVRQVMDNVRRMLKVRGCVVHIASFGMDHGLYALSPGFFYDFYGANGFGDFECHLLEVDFSDIARTYARRQRRVEYRYGMPLDGVLDFSKEVLVFFAARKLESRAALTIPTQGTYQRRSEAAAPAPAAPLFERVVPGWLRPAVAPARPVASAAHRAWKRLRARRGPGVGEI
jgi:hypothetical protein